MTVPSFDERAKLKFQSLNEDLIHGSCIPVVGLIPAIALLVVSVVELFFAARSAICNDNPYNYYPEDFTVEAGVGILYALATIATAGLGLALIQGVYVMWLRGRQDPFWFNE